MQRPSELESPTSAPEQPSRLSNNCPQLDYTISSLAHMPTSPTPRQREFVYGTCTGTAHDGASLTPRWPYVGASLTVCWFCLFYTRTNMFCVMHAHVFSCAYVFVVYMYVCVYVCKYIYVRAHVGVHMYSCRRILFICTVQSLYYMRVYHRCFCVCVGGLEVGFVSAYSWLALVTGVGGYVLAGVEIGGLSCIFLYFCGC